MQRSGAEDRLGRLPVPLELGERPGESSPGTCTGCRGCPGSRAPAARGSAGTPPPPRAARVVRGGSDRRSRRRFRAPRARSAPSARPPLRAPLRSRRGCPRRGGAVGWSRTSGYTHGDGGRAYRDLRRPLSRSASGRRVAQEAPRRAADDGGGRGARSLGIPLRRRKAATIGAFAIGTFCLGFTLGGLVFGRWRKA